MVSQNLVGNLRVQKMSVKCPNCYKEISELELEEMNYIHQSRINVGTLDEMAKRSEQQMWHDVQGLKKEVLRLTKIIRDMQKGNI